MHASKHRAAVFCRCVTHINFENRDTYRSEPSVATLCVAIGCGAGGAAALCELLRAMRGPSNLALTVVSNSEPLDLAEISNALDPAASLQLRSVEDHALCSVSGLYVLDPDTDYIVRQGRFHLLSGSDLDHSLSSVDRFFESLASDEGVRAGRDSAFLFRQRRYSRSESHQRFRWYDNGTHSP